MLNDILVLAEARKSAQLTSGSNGCWQRKAVRKPCCFGSGWTSSRLVWQKQLMLWKELSECYLSKTLLTRKHGLLFMRQRPGRRALTQNVSRIRTRSCFPCTNNSIWIILTDLLQNLDAWTPQCMSNLYLLRIPHKYMNLITGIC